MIKGKRIEKFEDLYDLDFGTMVFVTSSPSPIFPNKEIETDVLYEYVFDDEGNQLSRDLDDHSEVYNLNNIELDFEYMEIYLAIEEEKVNKSKIVIKENNQVKNEVCGCCGKPVNNSIPVGTFLEDTNQPVCYECVSEKNPELKKVLDTYFEYMDIQEGSKGLLQSVEKNVYYVTNPGFGDIDCGSERVVNAVVNIALDAFNLALERTKLSNEDKRFFVGEDLVNRAITELNEELLKKHIN